MKPSERKATENELARLRARQKQYLSGAASHGKTLYEALKAYKEKALSDIADLIRISAEKYGMNLGGKKGNISITAFDGELMIQRVYADRITYTEEMEVAKAKVFECVKNWGEVSNKHIVTLATRAYQTNKNGEISISRIIEMLSYEIDDPDWLQAMEAVRESLRVCGSAVYIRIYERDENGKYKNLPLNISAV